MLKIRLERGVQLDRQLETVARHLQKTIQAAADTGYARIYAYPRPAPALTLPVMTAIIADSGARPIVSLSPKPPSRVDVPTILLGYESLNYKAKDVDQPLFAVAPNIKTSPPPGATYVDGDGSVAGIIGLTLLTLGSLYARRDWIALLLAGSVQGEYSERSGKLLGLDRKLYEDVRDSDLGLGVELISTIKTYKPLTMPTCESLSSTIDPYYPGITGDPDFCLNLLESEGLGEAARKPPGKLIDEEIEKLALVVLNYLRERAKIRAEVDEYIGYILSSTNPFTVEDYRLASLAITGSLEAYATVSPLFSLADNLDVVYPSMERWFLDLSLQFPRLVEEAKPVRVKTVSWLRLYRVSAPQGTPLTSLYRALVTLDKIPQDSILVAARGDCRMISPFQAEEAYGPGTARKLVDTRVARPRGPMLCLEDAVQRH